MPPEPEEMKTLSDAARRAVQDRRANRVQVGSKPAEPGRTMSQSDFSKAQPMTDAMKTKKAADLAAALRKRGG